MQARRSTYERIIAATYPDLRDLVPVVTDRECVANSMWRLDDWRDWVRWTIAGGNNADAISITFTIIDASDAGCCSERR
jgi:hypothetical protein